MVVILAAAAAAFSLFYLVQIVRGGTGLPIFIPIVAMMTVIAISIYEGDGSHDLIWMGSLGLFLLANIYNTENSAYTLLFGGFILAAFTGIGLFEINGMLPNPFGTDLE